MNKKNMNVAVYGTLRTGFHNHGVLGNSKLIGSGWTKEKYELTANGIPFVNKEKPTSNVRVEVYSVTPEQIPSVDRLEGYNPNDHDGSWYKRSPIDITLDNNEKVKASLYFCNKSAQTLIKSGDYADYKR